MKSAIIWLLYKWSGYSQVLDLQENHPHQSGDEFLLRAADHFNVKSVCSGTDVTAAAGTVFLCNHHTGAVDILALYPHLRTKSQFLKIIVNEKLLALKVLNDMFIPVHPLSSQTQNPRALTQMVEHLRAGGNLLIYPAGRIAQKDADGEITDGPWAKGSAQLIQKYASRVVPIFVDARNSDFFYLIRKYFPRLSLLFILRELEKRRQETVRVYFGEPISSESLSLMNSRQLLIYLRNATYNLRSKYELGTTRSEHGRKMGSSFRKSPSAPDSRYSHQR